MKKKDASGADGSRLPTNRPGHAIGRVTGPILKLSDVMGDSQVRIPEAPFRRLEQGLEEREKEESNKARRSEIAEATLKELMMVRAELQQERLKGEKLAAQVQAHEQELARYRSGAPGRPGSSHLVIAEFQRRATDGQIECSLIEQARVLVEWLGSEHPGAIQITEKTVKNTIRDEFHRACKSAR